MTNNQNAMHSTGPKTEAGRDVVAQNALKHGDRGHACRTAIQSSSAFEFTSYVVDSLQARFQFLQFFRPDPDLLIFQH
ncbi:MAG: hypothetical protein H0U49_06105 [Parachlamydiaceae bacterium]|nr:hypothetical protein [Parachlamydiaceae bacterium]